jgi:hypothetical protein
VALDLAEQLESQPIQALRRVAAEAAGLAVTRIQLADPRLDAALATVRKGALSDPAERSRVRELTAELDEIAWDMQDKAEQGILPRQAYHEAFARARASAAVGFALEPDTLYAARESVYEAWHAIADPDAVRMAVINALH